MRPTALWVSSVNQRLPSAPAVMPQRPTPELSPVPTSGTAGPVAAAVGAPGPRTAAHSAIAVVIRPRTGLLSAAPSGP
jgi:hypothetical protein